MERNFEEPKEFDPDATRAELLTGRFKPTPHEIEAERRWMGARRETPEEARERLERKHREAMGRLREQQGDDAQKSLKKALVKG